MSARDKVGNQYNLKMSEPGLERNLCVTSEHLPPRPATDASKEGGKWKIQLHYFGVGHDPP